MIIFKIEASEELREKMKQAVEEQMNDLEDGEPFTFIHEGRAIVGRREGNKIIIDQIVDKVI